MSQQTPSEEGKGTSGGSPSQEVAYYQQTEEYGSDRLQARHGRVNFWLLLVYLALFLWALYYGYTYWGGLGPGLNLG